MARRIAILYLSFASPVILLSFCLRHVFAEYLFTVLVMAFPIALIVMAVSGKERLGPLAVPLVGLFVILEASGLTMLVLRGRVLENPWIGGLPAAAAVQLYGLWLAPLLLVAFAYALTFDRFELRKEDLDRLERARRSNAANP